MAYIVRPLDWDDYYEKSMPINPYVKLGGILPVCTCPDYPVEQLKIDPPITNKTKGVLTGALLK
jgi:hypothetical protein